MNTTNGVDGDDDEDDYHYKDVDDDDGDYDGGGEVMLLKSLWQQTKV